MKLINPKISGICNVCGKELDCIMNIICEDCRRKERNNKLDFAEEYNCEWVVGKEDK